MKPGGRIAIIDYEPARSPHRDQPALQVSKDQARAILADAGFKPLEDVALFEEKWFLIFGRSCEEEHRGGRWPVFIARQS